MGGRAEAEPEPEARQARTEVSAEVDEDLTRADISYRLVSLPPKLRQAARAKNVIQGSYQSAQAPSPFILHE